MNLKNQVTDWPKRTERLADSSLGFPQEASLNIQTKEGGMSPAHTTHMCSQLCACVCVCACMSKCVVRALHTQVSLHVTCVRAHAFVQILRSYTHFAVAFPRTSLRLQQVVSG